MTSARLADVSIKIRTGLKIKIELNKKTNICIPASFGYP